MTFKSVIFAAFLSSVCSTIQASEPVSSPIVIGIARAGPSFTQVSGNVDGIYASGSQSVATRSHLALFGNDGSFKWGRNIPCRSEAIQALPKGGVVTTGRCGKKSGRKIIAVGPSVLRFDAKGNLIWARTIVAGKKTRLRKLSANSAGDIFLAGYVAATRRWWSSIRRDIVHLDAFIIRLTKAGEVKWSRTFVTDDNSVGTEIGALVSLSEGRIAMTVSNKLVILDSLGNTISAYRLRLNGRPLDIRVMSRAGDNLVLTGTIRSNDARGLDAWAVSLRPLGKINWAVRLNVGASDQIWTVTGTPEAIMTIAGNTRRMGPTLEDKVHRMDGWLVRINRNGEIVGSFAVGYEGDDYLFTAAENGGALVLTGSIDDGRTGRRLLTFNPHLSSNTKKCHAIRNITTMVTKVNVESVSSEISLRGLDISGERFEPDMVSMFPVTQDLCSGAP